MMPKRTPTTRSKPPPTIQLHHERYLEFTQDFDMNDDQQRALITAIYNIMLAYVDIGFQMHPVQHIGDADIACGQPEKSESKHSTDLSDVIRSIITQDDLNDQLAHLSAAQISNV